MDSAAAAMPSSPSARMAAAIRARAHKSEMIRSDTTSLQPGSTKPRSLIQSSSSATNGTRGKLGLSSSGALGKSGSLIAKPTADELLLSYAKGKRDFTCHDLSLLNLQKTDLSGANFHQAKLHKINFQSANLANTDFGRTSLSQATLRHADLAGADLRGADLSYAYLSHANLRGANLCGADLTGAKVSDEQLAMARMNWSTIHPSGKRGLW
jgi:serine/threonine-protein kinase